METTVGERMGGAGSEGRKQARIYSCDDASGAGVAPCESSWDDLELKSELLFSASSKSDMLPACTLTSFSVRLLSVEASMCIILEHDLTDAVAYDRNRLRPAGPEGPEGGLRRDAKRRWPLGECSKRATLRKFCSELSRGHLRRRRRRAWLGR